jgi:cytochrome c7-like protein
MAQIFHRSANDLAKLSLLGVVLILGALGYVIFALGMSPLVTDVGVTKHQPVPFSHKHHVGELGIDCRYCHSSVEESSFAGLPPTATCMSCHSQIWLTSPMLEPVRASYRNDQAIEWVRVYALPDFVYFNHSIHVNKGVGCTTCHGPIAEMPLTWRATTLQMNWCLDCHQQPEKYVRPREAVFLPDYKPPADQMELGRKLVEEYRIQKLTHCSTCHR